MDPKPGLYLTCPSLQVCNNKRVNHEMADEVQWYNLPSEIWQNIAKRLDTLIDVLRFCSVCKSWRSSLPSASYKHFSIFPLKIPNPSQRPIGRQFGHTHLINNTVYLIQPINVDDDNHTDKQDLSSCTERGSGSGSGWLIKVEELEFGKFRLLHPLNCHDLKYPPATFPKVLNLMNCRVFELARAYSVKHAKRSVTFGVDKVVGFPRSVWTGAVEEVTMFSIYEGGKLGLLKLGDEKWTLVDDKNAYYDDIILHQGQVYVVDKWGTISWIDLSSLKLIQFSPPLCGFGDQKYMVESCGCLYVVDMFFDEHPANVRGRRRQPFSEVVAVKVYKLDEEWGTWVDVKNLGDRMFVLSQDVSFSVSAKRLAGYQSNCIYFSSRSETRVFDLENSRFGMLAYFPTCSEVFWSTSFTDDISKWLESRNTS